MAQKRVEGVGWQIPETVLFAGVLSCRVSGKGVLLAGKVVGVGSSCILLCRTRMYCVLNWRAPCTYLGLKKG